MLIVTVELHHSFQLSSYVTFLLPVKKTKGEKHIFSKVWRTSKSTPRTISAEAFPGTPDRNRIWDVKTSLHHIFQWSCLRLEGTRRPQALNSILHLIPLASQFIVAPLCDLLKRLQGCSSRGATLMTCSEVSWKLYYEFLKPPCFASLLLVGGSKCKLSSYECLNANLLMFFILDLFFLVFYFCCFGRLFLPSYIIVLFCLLSSLVGIVFFIPSSPPSVQWMFCFCCCFICHCAVSLCVFVFACESSRDVLASTGRSFCFYLYLIFLPSEKI